MKAGYAARGGRELPWRLISSVLAALLVIALVPSAGLAPAVEGAGARAAAAAADARDDASAAAAPGMPSAAFSEVSDVVGPEAGAAAGDGGDAGGAASEDADEPDGADDAPDPDSLALLAGGATARIEATGLPDGLAAGAVTLSAGGATGSSVEAAKGERVTVGVADVEGYYVAQVRWAEVPQGWDEAAEGEREPLAYEPLDAGSFAMPASDVSVAVDYVSIVWDGTIDVTWYDPDATTFSIRYAAQYEGLAAIVNGIFTAYPTKAAKTDEGLAYDAVDYEAYKRAMGVVEDASGKQVSSSLYGEFSATYRLSDSQRGHERTGDISVVQRVVGDPSFVAATKGVVGKVGENVEVTTTDFFRGIDDFDGKTVHVVADLDFGARKDAQGLWDPASPLFMPVGGCYAMLPGLEKTNGYAKVSTSWNGVLDGNGHSFSNVYCERYATGSFGDSVHVGLVGRIGLHDGDDEGLAAVDPTVRRIVFESGLVSGRRAVGGIVGKFGQTTASLSEDGSTGCVLEYCVNKATVIGTDKKGIGGVVGSSWNEGVVRWCANLGEVVMTATGVGFIAGGVTGSNEVDVIGCYNAGKVTAGKESCAMAIGTNNGGAAKTYDCWWLAGSASGGGYYDRAKDNIPDRSFTAAQAPGVAAKLNGDGAEVWVAGTGINELGGVSYPELYFQAEGFAGETFEVTLAECEHGSVTASPSSGAFGTSVKLGFEADAGWTLDYFTVDGKRLEGHASSFALGADAEVGAVFRELETAVLGAVDAGAFGEDCEVRVTKTGTAREDGGFARVDGAEVRPGDEVFEGDVLTVAVRLRDGALPDAEGETYSGGYVASVSWEGSQPGARELYGYAARAATYEVTGAEGRVSFELLELKTGASSWGEAADVSWREADPGATSYEISTAAELAGLAAIVNAGDGLAGVTVTLSADIDLATEEGLSWEPVGNARDAAFEGVFDGAGHEVSGMAVSVPAGYAGLFGHVSGAVVRDVRVGADCSVSGGSMVGGVVGCAERSEVSGCESAAAVTASGLYAGGVAGLVTGGRLSGCSNEGAVSGAEGARFVGGVAGMAEASAVVSGCENRGAVLVRAADGKSAEAGGVAGSANAASVLECLNVGPVAGEAGGPSQAGARYAGGIAGQLTSGGSVERCANEGEVAGLGFVAGGLAGFANDGAALRDCYNVGAVSADEAGAAGGLVGLVAGSRGSSLARCYSAGAVTGPADADGAGAVAAQVASSAPSSFADVYWLGGVCEGAGAFFGDADLDDVCPVNARVLGVLEPVLDAAGADAWRAGKAGVNDGFPLLSWQAGGAGTVGGEGSAGDDAGDDAGGTAKDEGDRKPSSVVQSGNQVGSTRDPGALATDGAGSGSAAGADGASSDPSGSSDSVDTGGQGGSSGSASADAGSALRAALLLAASVLLGAFLELRRKSREAATFGLRAR